MRMTNDPDSRTSLMLRRPYSELVLSGLFFGFCTAILAHEAETNDRGLILNGIIHFDRDGADVFYAVLAVLSAAITAFAGLGFLRVSQIKEFWITFGPEALSFPAAPLWSAKRISVPWDRIDAVETTLVGKRAMLKIHEGERAHVIPSRWFADLAAAREAAEMITARVRQHSREGVR
jgi:hypothetical protein